MGLFDFFKSNKTETKISTTGIYYIVNKNLIPLNELPKTGSYVDISESLGYKTFHGLITFESEKISYLAFKRRTKEPIFVEAKDNIRTLSYEDIAKIIQEIDWEFEWRQIDSK